MRAIRFCAPALLTILSCSLCSPALSAEPPQWIAASPENEACVLRESAREIRIYYIHRPDGREIYSIGSTDEGRTWSDARTEFELPGPAYYAVQVVCNTKGERHAIFHVRKGERSNLHYDVWYNHTTGGAWQKPEQIYDGYVGSLRCLVHLPEGRLLVPISFKARLDPQPRPQQDKNVDLGANDVTVLYRDGAGAWQRSASRLMVPQDLQRGRTNYGAVEPFITPLADGRLWMLIRTKNGQLWQSHSHDRGESWSPARPSRFIASDSPATTVRLADGRLVLFCNACQQWNDLRSYAIGGRQVLHAAISADDGQSWSGFREVHREVEPPPGTRGDRGTAYPSAIPTTDERILLVTGQGGAKAILRIDPAWLQATQASDTFGDGLQQWTWYGSEKPSLVKHEAGQALRLGRHREGLARGAVWNFPAFKRGNLVIKLRRQPHAPPLSIALTDHFGIVSDTQAAQHAMLHLAIDSAGKLSPLGQLEEDTWHTLRIRWDTSGDRATVQLDQAPAVALPVQNPTQLGINYLRLVSQPTDETGGWLVAAVEAAAW